MRYKLSNYPFLGAGLAGLSAAIELADRGYDVTIKEKMENSVGGKLSTKPVEALGQTFYVEHGFHGE
jgi:isorenieratene synthase